MTTIKLKKRLKVKNQIAHHRLGFWLSVVTAVLVMIGMTILILLPYGLEWGAERMLLSLGAKTATITDIDFNPLTGRLTVFDLQLQGSNADRAAMERFIIQIDLFPVLKKRIRFRQISLTGFSMDIRQQEDGRVTFGGLPIPESQKPEEPEPGVENESRPWGLGLRDLDVKELTIHMITPDLDETVVVNHFSLKDFETWAPEKSGEYVLRVDLLGGAVDVEGAVRPFTEPIDLSTRIGLRELPLERLTPYIKNTPVRSLSGSLSGRGLVNAALSLQSNLAIAGTVRFDVFSRDIAVQMATERLELELQPGTLNIGLSLDSSLTMGESSSKEAEFNITATLEKAASRVVTRTASIEVLQEAFSVEVAGSYSHAGALDPSRLTANAGLSLKGLVFKGVKGPAELVRMGSLDIQGIEIKGPDDILTSRIRAGDVALFPRLPDSVRKGEPQQALALKNLEVTGISVSDRSHLTVEAVQVDSLNAWVLREKDGGFEALGVVRGIMDNPKVNEKAHGDPQIDETGPQSSVVAHVGRFSLAGENSLAFRDLAVDPPFNFTFDSLSARINDLDTGGTNTTATVRLDAGMGKYSAVGVTGTVQPPWDTPDVDMHLELKAIDLPVLTPYTRKYLGYILRSGHLDTKMDIRVEKGALDSQADIVVNRIEMDAVKGENEKKAEERLGIPVNKALSLLKDKNDDIKLTLPVEGDLKDPEFDFSDVVVTATGLALQKSVTAYYKDLGATLLTGGLIPPGTFSIFGKLFSGVTTMAFEPVLFDPSASDLTAPSKAYLDLLSEKLDSKPKVRLVLCGKVTREDIMALRRSDLDAASAVTDPRATGSAAAGPVSGSPTDAAGEKRVLESGIPDMEVDKTEVPAGLPTIEEVPLSDDEKERLIELAKKRALAVKDYLTETGGLDPERLFVCYSDVETSEKKLPPRVDLSI
jgi:hypothetical protein